MVTGQTKPPRLGPSLAKMTGKSPVKLIAPMAYSQSWTLDGWSPASPPFSRAQLGVGPDSRMPRRLELKCTLHSDAKNSSIYSGLKKSGAPCGPYSTPIFHSLP